jgi:hypothetical protein
MSQAADVSEPTAGIGSAVVVAVVWLAWSMFSDTRHNHGFWVAFLLPLTPVIVPVLWIVYIFIKYSSYLVFVIIGRREDHEEFIRKLKVRTGFFLFLNNRIQ